MKLTNYGPFTIHIKFQTCLDNVSVFGQCRADCGTIAIAINVNNNLIISVLKAV